MDIFRRAVLSHDDRFGTCCTVARADARELRNSLVNSGLRLPPNLPRGARLARPGQRVMAFGPWPAYGLADCLVLDWYWEVEIGRTVASGSEHSSGPLHKVFTLGLPRDFRNDLNYVSLGLTAEHVPELIRIAVDWRLPAGPKTGEAIWAPVHAWRALGQLRAEAAIGPLMSLLTRIEDNHDHRILEEMGRVLGQMGPVVIPAAKQYLADAAHEDYARASAAEALRYVAEQHPRLRPMCLAPLCAQLEQYQTNSQDLNELLFLTLLCLRAVEAAPLLEKVFAAGMIDEGVAGDWEAIRTDLGLHRRRKRRHRGKRPPRSNRNSPPSP